MIRALGIGAAILVVVRRDIHFAPDDRLHAVGCGFMIKIRCREKVPVIGYGNRRHAPPRCFGREFANFTRTVKKGVIRMEMQMYEIRRRHVRLS